MSKQGKYWWQEPKEAIDSAAKISVYDKISEFYEEVAYIADGYYGPCIPDIVNIYAVAILRNKELESILGYDNE
jgi:hypothetical protein